MRRRNEVLGLFVAFVVAACGESSSGGGGGAGPSDAAGGAAGGSAGGGVGGSGGAAGSGAAGEGGSGGACGSAGAGGSAGLGGSAGSIEGDATADRGGAGGTMDAAVAGGGGMAGAAPELDASTDGGRPRDAGPEARAASDAAESTTMSFFVTSRNPGMGGNLGGLAGADAFCTMLASSGSPALGAKTWRAYLSTSTENARDRIGPGPWRNAAGRIVANNLADLHSQIGATAALNATWPLNSATTALDERGMEIPANPVQHDVLTGSNLDGTVLPALHCNNWTSQAATDMAQIGHSNRTGQGTNPTSWNSAHTVGCGPLTATNFQAGTVSSGGGRGSIYCFALP